MSTNEYPVFFQSTLLGATATALYTVPTGKALHDLQLKLTNTDGTAKTATVYVVQNPTTVHGLGAHDGADNASVLTDTGASWTTDQWVGYLVTNTTDGSSGEITANTATTITATLTGGTDNDWDIADAYEITHTPSILNEIFPGSSIPANDYSLVPVERADGGSVIYAKAQTAGVVSIQAVGGKLHTP